jgi:hypothetical protein
VADPIPLDHDTIICHPDDAHRFRETTASTLCDTSAVLRSGDAPESTWLRCSTQPTDTRKRSDRDRHRTM